MSSFFDLVGGAADRLIGIASVRWPLLAILTIAFVARWPEPPHFVARARQWFDAIASRRFLASTIVFVISLVWLIAPTCIHGVPSPWMHDDYGNLLGGDLFAHGHLSCPVHPLWQHFETMHQLQVPRHASKYPPGQGLVLAAGLRMFRLAIAGEWLVTAGACGAICWAAGVWLSPSLALFTGLAAAVHPTILEWGESYRGGGLAALAGALVIGACGRLLERTMSADAIVFALGVVLLAVSRPFEGLIYTFTCAALVLFRAAREKRLKELVRASVAGVVIVKIGLVAIGAYNHSITGSPFEMPYMLYQRQYDPVPVFAWQSLGRTPEYRNQEMATMYRIYLGHYQRLTAPGGFIEETEKKIDTMRFALFGRPAGSLASRIWPLFLVTLIALPHALRDPKARQLAMIVAVFLCAPFLITGWLLTHYLAPIAAAGAMLVVLLLRDLSQMLAWRRGAFLACVVTLFFFTNAAVGWVRWTRTPDPGLEVQRQRIEHVLLGRGGRHLIIVPPAIFDVLYNGAEIDRQPIIWARDLGPDANERLLRYYADRSVWWLMRRNGRVDVEPPPKSP